MLGRVWIWTLESWSEWTLDVAVFLGDVAYDASLALIRNSLSSPVRNSIRPQPHTPRR